jgi:hypothetical protein
MGETQESVNRGPLPGLKQRLRFGEGVLQYGPQLAEGLALDASVPDFPSGYSAVGGWVVDDLFRRLDVRYSLTGWVARMLLGEGVTRTMEDLPLAGGGGVALLASSELRAWSEHLDRVVGEPGALAISATDVMALAFKFKDVQLRKRLKKIKSPAPLVRDLLEGSIYVHAILHSSKPLVDFPTSQVMQEWFAASAFRGLRRRAARNWASGSKPFRDWLTPPGEGPVPINLVAMAVDWLMVVSNRDGALVAADLVPVEKLIERAELKRHHWLSLSLAQVAKEKNEY